jgi:hypothetical protein
MKTACFAFLALMTGCATSSGVLKMGPDTYSVSVSAAPARGGITGAKRMAYAEATQECEKQGKELLAVSEESGHDFPAAGRVDLTFRCLDKNDPALSAQPSRQ